MRRSSAKPWLIVVAVCLLFGVVALGTYLHLKHRPQAFIEHWSEHFSTVNRLDLAQRFARTEPVIVRIFPSGEWLIATCEYSCCGGAGFNATVIRDSTGAIYTNVGRNFCGIEGLDEELGERLNPATSLPEFYSTLSGIELQKR